MADIQPPSFSLGLDLDSPISDPHNPYPNPDPDPLAHPSFSLGLDFETQCGGPQNNNNAPFGNQEKEGDEFGLGLRVSDSDSDSDHDDEPGPVLRRLRRGGPHRKEEGRLLRSDDFVDDDIEELSSQEFDPTTDDLPTPRNNTTCSSSKVSLSSCGILTSQHESEIHNKKRKQDSSRPSTTTSVNATRAKSVLSDLAASPLRKFQFLDSDSDLYGPSEGVHSEKDAAVVGCSNQEKRKGSIQDYFQFTAKKKIKSSNHVSEKQDLWKDFYKDETHAVSTPVFDDFFSEYFSAVKKKEASSSVTEYCSNELGKNANFTNRIKQHTDIEFSGPPSHRYFFHDDLRIQNLVHNRLPYFCPLVAHDDTRNKPSNQSGIDYMSQFGHGDASKQQAGKQSNAGKSSQRSQISNGNASKRPTAKKSNAGKSARRSGKKVRTCNGEGTSDGSGEWVNPKQIANIPKDAGKRRVHADGQSAGHWFTAENGKKVYVTSNGKELTGRQAYTHYRKESGKAFKRTKNKTSKKKVS